MPIVSDPNDFRDWDPQQSERDLHGIQKWRVIIVGALFGAVTAAAMAFSAAIEVARNMSHEADYSLVPFCAPFGLIIGGIVALRTVNALREQFDAVVNEPLWMGAALVVALVLTVAANILAVLLFLGIVL